MAKDPTKDLKVQALRKHGTLALHPERVSDALFQEHEFFDPRDLMQIKYEMLRRVRAEGHSVSQAAATFGLSRPSYYQAQSAFEREGLVGLVPKKRGPRGGHKLTAEILQVVDEWIAADKELKPDALVERVLQRFGVKVHPRSLERALARRKKKPQ